MTAQRADFDITRAAFDLFTQWLEADAPERTQLLDRIAQQDASLHERLLALIAADHGADAAAFLADSALLDIAVTHAPPADSDPGDRRVGAWVLDRSIGTGGMGQVWLARRNDGQHGGVAAIKMLRVAVADAHANARFAQEGRILAQLAHPHIAMLLDAGFSADGQRFLVLEYVDGEPIDRWCDARRLELGARLGVFLQVCAAVAHAHAHLVVHRDLKPSNILVLADGNAKLLDFGVAKLIERAASEPLTIDATAALTPGYAAPEQITGAPISTATDVHALGAILCRLLAGHSAFGSERSTPAQLARAVVDDEPRRLTDFGADLDITAIAAARSTTPERLRRALRGDLEVIVAKALKKSPEQRYASAQALADDVRRHLEHRPITVRADSAAYRARRFMRRHWLPLCAAALLMLVVIVSATLIAAQSRQTAREARATLAVKDFLFGLFTAVDPAEARGKEISARELLDRGRERVEADAHGDPALKAELRATLGRIYGQLGLFPQAVELQQHAIAALKSAGSMPGLLVRTEIEYANSLREQGDLKGASAAVLDAQQNLEAWPKSTVEDQIRVLTARAKIEISRRDFASAKRYADASVALGKASPVDTALQAESTWTKASAEWGLKSLDRAEADFREALRLMTLAQGDSSPRVGILHGNLAMVMRSQSKYAQALTEGETGLAIDQRTLGPKHPTVANDHATLGLTHYHLGHYQQARELLEQAADVQRSGVGIDSPARAGFLINLGLVLIEIPDLDAAEKAFTESLRIWQGKYGKEFPGTLVALAGLGRVHLLQGRLDQAQTELSEVHAMDVKLGVRDDYANLYELGELHRARHDTLAAVTLDREAVQRARHDTGERSRYSALAHHYLGLALRDSGDAVAAESELRAALAAFGYIPDAAHPWAATTRLELSRLLAQRPGTADEVHHLLAEALAIRERFFGADDPRTLEVRNELAARSAD
ncbi:MAG: serine/threonine-protein kinase [Dokdonella sp.]